MKWLIDTNSLRANIHNRTDHVQTVSKARCAVLCKWGQISVTALWEITLCAAGCHTLLVKTEWSNALRLLEQSAATDSKCNKTNPDFSKNPGSFGWNFVLNPSGMIVSFIIIYLLNLRKIIPKIMDDMKHEIESLRKWLSDQQDENKDLKIALKERSDTPNS